MAYPYITEKTAEEIWKKVKTKRKELEDALRQFVHLEVDQANKVTRSSGTLKGISTEIGTLVTTPSTVTTTKLRDIQRKLDEVIKDLDAAAKIIGPGYF